MSCDCKKVLAHVAAALRQASQWIGDPTDGPNDKEQAQEAAMVAVAQCIEHALEEASPDKAGAP